MQVCYLCATSTVCIWAHANCPANATKHTQLFKGWLSIQPRLHDGAAHREADENSSIVQARFERPPPGLTPDVVFPENSDILAYSAVRTPFDGTGL